MMVLPFVFIPFIVNFPVGLVIYWVTTNLWTVGQGLDHAAADAEDARRRRSARRGRRRRTRAQRRRRRRSRDGAEPTPKPRGTGRRAGSSGRRRRRAAMTEELARSRRPARPSARRSGRRCASSSGCIRGSTRRAVRFQVVSEGERGLLGVGYAPARVVATVAADAVAGRRRPPATTRASSPPTCASSLERITAGDRRPLPRSTSTRTTRRSPPRAPARDLGLLIGRHGQTIDAIQYLANAIVCARRRRRAQGRGRRRGRLPRPAARRRSRRWRCAAPSEALADRRAVELEPMTAVERKIVHLRLKDVRRRRDGERGHRAEPLRRRHRPRG